jgi:hypothetical protein
MIWFIALSVVYLAVGILTCRSDYKIQQIESTKRPKVRGYMVPFWPLVLLGFALFCLVDLVEFMVTYKNNVSK